MCVNRSSRRRNRRNSGPDQGRQVPAEVDGRQVPREENQGRAATRGGEGDVSHTGYAEEATQCKQA